MHIKVSCVQQNTDDKIQGLIQKSILLSHVLDVKHMLIKGHCLNELGIG